MVQQKQSLENRLWKSAWASVTEGRNTDVPSLIFHLEVGGWHVRSVHSKESILRNPQDHKRIFKILIYELECQIDGRDFPWNTP